MSILYGLSGRLCFLRDVRVCVYIYILMVCKGFMGGWRRYEIIWRIFGLLLFFYD